MLAFVMFVGVFPASASAFIDPPLTGSTGTGWDNFGPPPGEIVFESGPGTPPPLPGTDPPEESPSPALPPIAPGFDYGDALAPGELPTPGEDGITEDADIDYPPATGPPEEDEELEEELPYEDEQTDLGDMPPDLAAALLAYAAGANRAIADRSPIMPMAMPGDIGTIQFQNQSAGSLPIDLNYWPVINWVNRPGEALTPFCARFGPDPREGVPYVAVAHSNTQILRLLIAYEQGLTSDRLGVQVAIWGITEGWQSWANWDRAAAARNAAQGVDVTGWRLLRFTGPAGSQPLFAAVEDDIPPPPPPPDEEDKQFEVRWSIESHTETTFTREASIEITDARGQLLIRKQNQAHEPLDGALFNIRIDFSDGSFQQINGWEAYNGGRLLTWNHPVGNRDAATVTVTEVRAPQHYTIDVNNVRTATVSPSYTLWEHVQYWEETVTTFTYWWEVILIQNGEETTVDRVEYDHGQTVSRSPWNRNTTTDSVVGDLHQSVTFVNVRERGTLIVYKRCAVTGNLLQGAEFRVEGVDLGEAGTFNQTGVTGAGGYVVFNNLFPGSYRITETRAPHTHNTDAPPQTVSIQSNETVRVTFDNTRRQGLTILKVDNYGNPLQGAVFEVRRGSGQVLGSFISDSNGLVIIPYYHLSTGYYIVEEIQAPDFFLIDTANNPQSIWIDNTQQNQHYSLVFRNFRMPSIEIIKMDGDNPTERLAGAVFRVTNTRTGQYFDVTSDGNGRAYLPGLELNTTYMVEETQSPANFVRSLYRREIVLRENRTHTIVVPNFREPAITIVKRCTHTGDRLPGATFRVSWNNGAAFTDVTTNADGEAVVNGLESGLHTIVETRSPVGFLLNSEPILVLLNPGEHRVIEVFNERIPGLLVTKRCAVTHAPIANTLFNVTQIRGHYRRDLGTFSTAQNGTFYIPNLTAGYVIITELRASEGFFLDSTPHLFYVQADRVNMLELFNEPYSNLRLTKICAVDRTPLADAVFRLFDDRRREIGTFTTNAAGEILITGQRSGMFYLQEVRSPAGYLLDTTVRQIELTGGQTTSIEWPNTPLGSLRIIKRCYHTSEPLYGVEFEILDAQNNILGRFTTDREGIITFGRNLAPGRYQIREHRAAPGYLLDERRHWVTIPDDGSAVELVLYNQLKRGQIQIVKRAAEANRVTGDRAGALLSGAVFEIINERLDVVDTIETDSRGVAISSMLPLGRYAIREVESPDFWLLYEGIFYADIRMHGDLIRFEVLNHPADLEVTIDKRGNVEALAGDVIRFDFTNIANESNVPLDDFFWRDILPEEVRLERLVTGTWSDRVRFRVVYATNLRSNYRVWQANMLSTVNHELDVADLNLAANEFVTSFRVEFGTVPAGFREDATPHIFTRVLDDLPHEHRIVNRVEAGGRVNDDYVYDLSSWVTIVFAFPRGALPQTGLQAVEQLTADS